MDAKAAAGNHLHRLEKNISSMTLARFNWAADGHASRLAKKVRIVSIRDPGSRSGWGNEVYFSQQVIENDLWFGVLRLGNAMLHSLTLLYAASGTAMISTLESQHRAVHINSF